MALKQAITVPGQTVPVPGSSVAYFASNSGATYSATLEVNIAGDWLPAAAAITQAGNMTIVLFIGKPAFSQEPVLWRWNVTSISGGTLTVYLG